MAAAMDRMGTSTTALYERLGIPPAATDDEIRRAYRKLALRYHPDKNRSADPEVFQAINHAYDILGDPKKRAVYDRYGEFGVSMLGTVGGAIFDPDIADVVCCLFLAITLLVLLAVLLLIFIALRVDGIILWNWATVFTPLWFVMVGAGILVVIQISRGSDTFDLEEGELEDLFEGMSPAERQATQAELRAQKRRTLRIHQAWSALYYLLFLALAITVVVHLQSTGGTTLISAFVPYFLLEVVTGLGKAADVANVIRKGQPADVDADDETTAAPTAPMALTKKLSVILDRFWWLALRLVFMILLALRADGKIGASWAVVFAPLYLVFFWHVYKLLTLYHRARFLPGPDAKKQANTLFVLALIVLVVVGGTAYATIAMIVIRIENPGSISAAAAISPLFAVLGILFCCSCCCLPCSLLAAPGNLREMDATENGRLAGRGLRITDGTAPSDNPRDEILARGEGSRRKRNKRATATDADATAVTSPPAGALEMTANPSSSGSAVALLP